MGLGQDSRGSAQGSLRIRLLGGVEARAGSDPDRLLLDIGPAKCRAILAVLALAAGTPVPVPRIIEVVWGSDPPRTAEKTLQSYMTRLRKALGTQSIVRVGTAYRLDVSPAAVDANRFRDRLDRGDVAGALSEWGGSPLAGLEVTGLAPTVEGLVEQWLGAVETQLEQQVDNDAAAAVGSLTELTADHPFREGLWALLMTALYRSGRQAEALAAYRQAREHLVEELGVEPGPRLRELELSILDQDERLGAGRSTRPPTVNLPSGTVTFAFFDIENESALWAAGRQDMAKAIGRLDELVQVAGADCDGHSFGSDGAVRSVAFHRAGQALQWAADLQAAVAAEVWPRDVPLAIRIGLHTGEPEQLRNGYFGPAVNIAAGLVAVAYGGQTLLSGVTAALVGPAGLRDLGNFRLDGVVVDQHILQLGEQDFPPLRTEDQHRGNLPNPPGRLIGRADSLDQVASALDQSALVTLVGPGGIGKTRLALAAARQWADANRGQVWFIELAGIASSNDVARAVANALQVKETPGNPVIESVVTLLANRPALLVLDNCEHVVDGAALVAEAVSARCPGTRVLSTSREGFGLRTEQLIAVAPLKPADAGVELFNERASAASYSFDPEQNRPEVEEICRRLDGVPLAIELAAARITSMSPADLVERLDDRLRLLTGGRRTTVERHRTLRATIQWSYDLLTQAEQLLFERLSIFAGPFDLQAAETVAAEIDSPVVDSTGTSNGSLGRTRTRSEGPDVDDLMGGLVDRSMVIVESGPFGRRFRLLETMRQFAAEHLSDSGRTDLVAARHADWCLGQVTAIRELLSGHREIEGVARLDELWPNLRAAIDWACTNGDIPLAVTLVRPVAAEIALRNNTEIGDWVERILAATGPGQREEVAFCLSWAGHRYMLSRDVEAFERLADRYGQRDHPLVRHATAIVRDEDANMLEEGPDAVIMLRAQGDEYLARLYEISSGVGPLLALGRFAEHDERAAEKMIQFREEGPPTMYHWVLFCSGYSALFQGKHEEADRFLELAAEVDLPDRTISLNKTIEARAAMRRGQPRRAYEILRSHIDELIETDNLVVGGLTCTEFMKMMLAVGRHREAARLFGYMKAGSAFTDLAAETFLSDVSDLMGPEHGVTEEDLAFGSTLNPREALAYVSQTLTDLLNEVPAAAKA